MSHDLASVPSLRVCAETTCDPHERREGATCGIKPYSGVALLSWLAPQDRPSATPVSSAKGKFSSDVCAEQAQPLSFCVQSTHQKEKSDVVFLVVDPFSGGGPPGAPLAAAKIRCFRSSQLSGCDTASSQSGQLPWPRRGGLV